ncbi:hypothetical protein [Streptomyces mayteni]
MVARLYGQEALTDGLVPRLVGLERLRDRRVDQEFPGARPVVEVSGGRAGGKTELLAALYDGYHGRVPLARADLAVPGFGEPGLAGLPGGGPAGTPPRNASPVTQLLYLLSYKLGLRPRRFAQAPAFPRLALGLLVVTTWRPGTGDETHVAPAGLRAAEDRLREIIREDSPDARRRRELLRQWFDALAANLTAPLAVLPGMVPIAEATLATARDQLLSPRPDRGALRWWGERLGRFQGDDLQRLFAMVRDFRRLDASRESAERLLVAALLHDIADHYGFLRRRNQTPAPLILLDNAHTEVGRHLLRLLLRAWDSLPSGAVRPVVVTTRPAVSTGGLGMADIASGTPWEPTPGNDSERWLLRVELAAVQAEDIERMLGDADYPPHLPRLVARLSGGRAGCARLLADAALERLGTGDALDPRGLLELPPGGGESEAPGTVGEQVLDRLLPDRRLRADLTGLVVALDDAAARRLWTLVGADRPADDDHRHPAGGRLRAVREELDAPHWRREPWHWPAGQERPGDQPVLGTAPLVGDRALRALLLCRLAATADLEQWTRLHRRLRAGYNRDDLPPQAVTHDAPYLHHTLALGDFDAVERSLHQMFATVGPEEWLAVLNVVCAAPHPPRDQRETPRRSEPCRACAAPAGDGRDSPAAHRAIGRLTRAVWRLSDPLAVAGADEDVDRVESALLTLYEHHDERDVLLSAWREWPARLRDGAQAPDLPIPRGYRP